MGGEKAKIHCNVASYIYARTIEKVKIVQTIRTIRKLLIGTIRTMRKITIRRSVSTQ
jgi:hypothetical protein